MGIRFIISTSTETHNPNGIWLPLLVSLESPTNHRTSDGNLAQDRTAFEGPPQPQASLSLTCAQVPMFPSNTHIAPPTWALPLSAPSPEPVGAAEPGLRKGRRRSGAMGRQAPRVREGLGAWLWFDRQGMSWNRGEKPTAGRSFPGTSPFSVGFNPQPPLHPPKKTQHARSRSKAPQSVGQSPELGEQT